MFEVYVTHFIMGCIFAATGVAVRRQPWCRHTWKHQLPIGLLLLALETAVVVNVAG